MYLALWDLKTRYRVNGNTQKSLAEKHPGQGRFRPIFFFQGYGNLFPSPTEQVLFLKHRFLYCRAAACSFRTGWVRKKQNEKWVMYLALWDLKTRFIINKNA